jgi:hypothetical protein
MILYSILLRQTSHYKCKDLMNTLMRRRTLKGSRLLVKYHSRTRMSVRGLGREEDKYALGIQFHALLHGKVIASHFYANW